MGGGGWGTGAESGSRAATTGAESTKGLERPLLAYDSSPKAHEGLYVATYVGGRWGTPLVVAT